MAPERGPQRGYCPPCSRDQRPRPTAAQRGYPRRWRRQRARHLARFPYCAVCGEPATVADHVLPLLDGGPPTDENLQSLCRSHHATKTAADLRARRARERDNPEG